MTEDQKSALHPSYYSPATSCFLEKISCTIVVTDSTENTEATENTEKNSNFHLCALCALCITISQDRLFCDDVCYFRVVLAKPPLCPLCSLCPLWHSFLVAAVPRCVSVLSVVILFGCGHAALCFYRCDPHVSTPMGYSAIARQIGVSPWR